MSEVSILHADCMEYMAVQVDNAFDLAIVDPPYGIDVGNTLTGPQRGSGNGLAQKTEFKPKDWDKSAPPPEYFDELRRVSKNQIIWGANYMTDNLPPSMAGLCGIRTTEPPTLQTASWPILRLIERLESSLILGMA